MIQWTFYSDCSYYITKMGQEQNCEQLGGAVQKANWPNKSNLILVNLRKVICSSSQNISKERM